MKHTFTDNNSKELIVFFNGWGMDNNTLNHFNDEARDVLTFYDYRSDLCLPNISLKQYDNVYLIAWSMGVFVANQLASKLNLKIDKSIALCGSVCPVHNEYGISVKIFDLTCKGLKLVGTEKFFKQMLGNYVSSFFKKPEREILEQIDELINLKNVSIDVVKEEYFWDVVLIANYDLIFPSSHLSAYWQGRTRVHKEDIPHYPFNKYDTWNKILSI